MFQQSDIHTQMLINKYNLEYGHVIKLYLYANLFFLQIIIQL